MLNRLPSLFSLRRSGQVPPRRNPPAPLPGREFEIEPIADDRGWKLTLRDEDGAEAGGGVFPADDDSYQDALDTGRSWIGAEAAR